MIALEGRAQAFGVVKQMSGHPERHAGGHIVRHIVDKKRASGFDVVAFEQGMEQARIGLRKLWM